VRFKKVTIVAALVISVWLCVTLFGLNSFGIHDSWPAFLVLLFFFESGAKTEKLKSIFLGAAVGLLVALCLFKGVELLAPTLGLQMSIFVMVFLSVFLLIALGDISHVLFNNYAFCYFTVALIYQQQATIQWLLVLFLGGGFFVGAVILSLNKLLKPNNASPKATTD